MEDIAGRIGLNPEVPRKRQLGHIRDFLASLGRSAWHGRITIGIGTVQDRGARLRGIEPQVQFFVIRIGIVIPMEGHLAIIIRLVRTRSRAGTIVRAG